MPGLRDVWRRLSTRPEPESSPETYPAYDSVTSTYDHTYGAIRYHIATPFGDFQTTDPRVVQQAMRGDIDTSHVYFGGLGPAVDPHPPDEINQYVAKQKEQDRYNAMLDELMTRRLGTPGGLIPVQRPESIIIDDREELEYRLRRYEDLDEHSPALQEAMAFGEASSRQRDSFRA